MLLDRLELRLPLLTTAARDLPTRHQTLRNTIAWSYDLLSLAEQHLFRHLAVIAGDFTLETAEALGDGGGQAYRPEGDSPVGRGGERGRGRKTLPLSPHGGSRVPLNAPALSPLLSVLDGITALVEKDLIVRETTGDGDVRFTMRETLREVAPERLDTAGETAGARRRHASTFVRFAQQHAPASATANTSATCSPAWPMPPTAGATSTKRSRRSWSRSGSCVRSTTPSVSSSP
jgi:predicted ATPase